MASQPEKQTKAMQILPNIARSKGIQTMKFGQLIVYKVRNVFVEILTKNVVQKLFSDTILKNQN